MKDFHIHTKYSDGKYTEYEILEKIKSAGITEFAITDHDTIEGSKKVYNLIKNNVNEIKFHTGIELSCRVFNYQKPVNVHILVYNFNYKDEDVLKFIKTVSSFRLIKLQRMIDFVKQVYNIDIKSEDIDEVLKQTKSIGKPHIYQIISKYHNIDREDYYNKMNNLKTQDLKLCAEEVIAKLSVKGYMITLAHPVEIMEEYNLTFEDIDKLVKYLKGYGLNGLEVYHSKQTKNQQQVFLQIAKKHNMQVTYGSDFHGENIKPNVLIGKCYKD